MQKDLTTLLIERDAQQHRAELEKLREENQRLLQQVSNKIDNAKAEITESAITKTMAVLNHTRAWLLAIVSALAVTLAVIGFVGVNGLTRQLTVYYTDTIHNWLRFDDGNSESHKILDNLRTSALLDSLSLRFAREKTHSSLTPTLNEAEKQRLMSIILNPAADDYQFRDALNLIIASRGIFGRVMADETGKKIADILADNHYNNGKKVTVLEAMSNDRALLPFTLKMLNSGNATYDENVLMDAFANVKQFDDQRARQFAEENLMRFKSANNRIELAKYLIDIDADSSAIDALINELGQQKKTLWQGDDRTLIFARIEHKLKATPPDVPALAAMIDSQIANGLDMSISTFGEGKPYFILSRDNFRQAFSQPESLVGNRQLVDAIVKHAPLNASRLQKICDFFQTRDRGLWLTTQMMKPAPDTRLSFDNGKTIQGSDILDTLWLRVEKRAGKYALIATWREKSGHVDEGVITALSGGEQASYSVDFNSEQLRNYVWSDNSDYWQL
ncbi:hypothetical protein EHW66_11935 [Erwinia psidii]|uniref:hypothetical protein n=1 Tax=Erwinia psidii TaxID=69224 RepID=UPI00226B4020|nr:hypothetical protein [Erwinia psidii]MCX8965685.1 hypothetical protein [Erwinia psidii]